MNKLPKNREPLYPAAFQALPLGAIKPRGWLLNQLKVQANGLTGHLDEFWPDVGPTAAGWAETVNPGSAVPIISTACFPWPICSKMSAC